MSDTFTARARYDVIQDTLLLLLNQTFICPVAYLESYQLLLEGASAREVNQTLNALGYELTQLGEKDHPEVFFCAPLDFNRRRDRDYAEKMLKDMRDDVDACLQFFLLLDQAGHGQVSVVSRAEIALADVLNAVESSAAYREQLRDMEAYSMFESLTKRKDNKERLTQLFNVMLRQGYLVRRSSESSVYVFTGKVGYFHRMMAWLKDHHGLESANKPVEPEQRGLFV